MQFSAVEDISAPIDKVFEQLTDFDSIQRQAMRRGIDVRRSYEGTMPRPGEGWQAGFRFRGKERQADITLAEIDAPHLLCFSGVSGGIETETRVELVPLSRGHTRVSVDMKMSPKTLSARLLVQSLKLARGNLNRKFRKRMAVFARELESRTV